MDYAPRGVAVIDLGNFNSRTDWSTSGEYSIRPLQGQTVLQRMIRRLSEAQQIRSITVTGSNLPTEVLTCGFVGAEVVDLPSKHVCERLAQVADRTQADWIVYAPANRPFIDPVLVDCLLTHARRAGDFDYVAFHSAIDGLRRMHELGLCGEVVHSDALRRMRRNLKPFDDHSESASCLADLILENDGVYQMRYVPIPEQLDRPDLRFSIQSEADWDSVQTLASDLRSDCTDWQPLADLALRNTDVATSMRARNTLV